MSNIISKKTRTQKSYIIEETHLYNILLDTREIFLHSCFDVEEEGGTDFRMANMFLKNLRLLESNGNGPITIHQHNFGGSVDCGFLIYDIISNSSCHIIIIMHGTACSMGSIIPQAADTRVIMPNCSFMIHDGNTGIEQRLTHKQSQSWAEIEEQERNIMLDIYCDVCSSGSYFRQNQATKSAIKKFITDKMDQKADWWLSPSDVVYYGFADAIFGSAGYENIETIKESTVNEE